MVFRGKWMPTPEDEMLSRPMIPDEISSKTSGTPVIIRGDGLRAASIQRLTGRGHDFNGEKAKKGYMAIATRTEKSSLPNKTEASK